MREWAINRARRVHAPRRLAASETELAVVINARETGVLLPSSTRYKRNLVAVDFHAGAARRGLLFPLAPFV